MKPIAFLCPILCPIFSSILLPAFSLKDATKLCINCKFFKTVVPDDASYGKCTLFPIVENNLSYLVTGVEKIDYFYCNVARKHNEMCGTKGTYYRKRLPEKGE